MVKLPKAWCYRVFFTQRVFSVFGTITERSDFSQSFHPQIIRTFQETATPYGHVKKRIYIYIYIDIYINTHAHTQLCTEDHTSVNANILLQTHTA